MNATRPRPAWWALVWLLGWAQPGGVGAEVEILRDPWGIPHVFAAVESDGFFGLGYAVAEDRLLQMELIRRKAAGRLAEVFGAEWVDADREARIAGYGPYAPRAFARLPERWQTALAAYAGGVNAWREAHADLVARRFQPLGILPEPWTPEDCLLASRGILSLGSPFGTAAVEDHHRFRELLERMGEAEASRQSGLVMDDAAAIVSEADMAKDPEVYERLRQRPRMTGFNLRPAETDEGRKMSHAWAVGGRRSTTGKPILESDPQLPLSSPPFFYEFHLAAGALDARGIGIPGCPGLFVGWNRHLAWGASALGVDAHVTFIDRLSADGRHFVFEGRDVPFERRLEHIQVRGGTAVVQEVLENRHGTVFNALVKSPRSGEAYVLYDAQTREHGANARMMLEVMAASTWTEFRRAMAFYFSPGLHVVYADTAGNLAYHTVVHRPATSRSPRRALEGWTGQEEVRGRIPFEELPHVLNPDAGFVSHANNLPVGSWYPYDLGIATGGTGHTSRSLRLRQLLENGGRFSVDDFERLLHRDDVNSIVAALLPVARQVAEEDRIGDPAILSLLEAVRAWDFHETTIDRFPAARGLANTLTPYRGSGLNARYGAGSGGVANLARDLADTFRTRGTTPTDTRVRAYLVHWLRASASASTTTGARSPRGAAINANANTNTSGTTGGTIGAASDEWTARLSPGRPSARATDRTIPIPYQRTAPLNFPPVDPAQDLVSPPLSCLDTGTIWSQPGNLYSQIVDLADIDNSRAMIAPGNAEAGPSRTNQVHLWARGTLRPAPLSRARLEALGAVRTRLEPKWTRAAARAQEPSPDASATHGVRFVPAIPTPTPDPTAPSAKPLPGRKPDDPRLEAAFRFILRRGSPDAEVDARLAECKDYVRGNPELGEQLRNACVLGIHLIEEAAAGRLKVPYGSPHVRDRLQELLRDLESTKTDAERR